VTKVYLRNPYDYIDRLVDSGHRVVSWDMGSFKRRNIDPLKFLRMRLGQAQPWELMTIAVEGASIYNEDSTNLDKPIAVYPCWLPDQGFDVLVDLCERPVSEDVALQKNVNIPARFRPVPGQRHCVVIYDFKDIGEVEGMNWFRQLRKVMSEYPDVDFIAHGTRSFRIMFGGDFAACTFNPWWSAQNKELQLPNGSAESLDNVRKVMPWIKLLGYSIRAFQDRLDVCSYNIESIRWAADNYLHNIDFKLSIEREIDVDSPGGQYELRDARSTLFDTRTSIAFKPGDGVLCDACSVAPKCKFYREGAVCGVSKTEAGKLAQMFGSRDADTILDGLSKIAEIQAERVGADLAQEAATGERTPDTDKRLKDLFDSGVKIAKLRKPELNGKGVQVNVGMIGGGTMTVQSTPQELIAGAVKALEARGVPREKITDDVIVGLLEGVASRDGAAKIEEIIDAELVD
jgi:hypothetical protein